MRIGFVVARLGDEKNVVQKLAVELTKELKRQRQQVKILRFTKKSMLSPLWRWHLNCFDVVFIANVGLQCMFLCVLKQLRIIRKPFVVFSFGSDIREVENWLVNFFNWVCAPVIDVLVPINPDLVPIAKKRGYKRVEYVHNWAEALA